MGRIPRASRPRVLKGLLVLSAVSCLLRPEGFGWPRETLAPLLAPLSHACTHVAASVKRNVRDLLGREIDERTAQQLLADSPALRRQLMRYVDQARHRQVLFLTAESARLRRRLAEIGRWRHALDDDFPCMLIPATVVGYGPTPYQRSRLLRTRGRAAPGQLVASPTLLTDRPTAILGRRAVLSASGLAGQIVASGAWTAHMQLVTDPDFKIRAMVKRVIDPGHPRTITVYRDHDGRQVPVTRELTAEDEQVPVNLAGCITAMVTAELPARHGIAEGDIVRTAGDDTRLPTGVLIGTVTRVRPVPDKAKHVTLEVTPAARLGTLRNVIIVVPQVREGR